MEFTGSSHTPPSSELRADEWCLNLSRRSLLTTALVGLSGTAYATSSYPRSTITVLVPFSAGSGNDIVARALATKMPGLLGGSMIVDDRAGASGEIAVEATLRARPDGYTLLLGSVGISINRYVLHRHYEASDFTCVAKVAHLPFTLFVNKSVPASNLKELAAVMKAHPDKFSAGEGGAVGSNHFILEAFKKAAGVSFTSVPYKGTADALVDLLAGRIQMMVAPISTGLPYYKTGQVKELGISGNARVPLMPDVPTFTEQGYPAMDISTWFALLGPKGIPTDVVHKLSQAAEKALKTKSVTTTLTRLGIVPDYAPPAQMAAFLKSNMMDWKKLLTSAGIK